MAQTPKFSGAVIAALVDFFAEQPSQPASELILNADINATALSIVSTTAIPASWPQPGRFAIDGEVIEYASYSGSTFTITNTGKRGLETSFGAGAAASHTAGAAIVQAPTAQAWAQVVAEIISIQTQITNGLLNPNLVLNSDYGRRTVLGSSMLEAFGDTTAWTLTDYGTVLGSVASNGLTPGNTGLWRAKWNGPVTMWRDGRWSAQFKATVAGGDFALEKYTSISDNVRAYQSAGGLYLQKTIGGVSSNPANATQALVLNNWYWLELESQGTTYIARLYSSGAAAGTKASATLLQSISATIADASVVSGGISLYQGAGTTTATIWGGVSASPGGVYVETWLPESYTFAFNGGVLGGQAVGYDDSADAGPIGKQWALRGYIPATNRNIEFYGPAAAVGFFMSPSTAYAASLYTKVSGKGGTGDLVRINFNTAAADGSSASVLAGLVDAGETSWTRKASTATSASTTRRGYVDCYFNNGLTATGTGWVMLPQYEPGSIITTWRPAPADDAPMTAQVQSGLASSTTSAAYIEADPRDAAINLLLPWDAIVEVDCLTTARNSAAGNGMLSDIMVDGVAADDSAYITAPVAAYNVQMIVRKRVALSAGKHRFSVVIRTLAGTMTWGDRPTRLIVTAYRGK